MSWISRSSRLAENLLVPFVFLYAMLASIQHPLGVGGVWDENIKRSTSAVTTLQDEFCAIAH